MPAINVAKTDTFEIQRQKINNIGTQIFNISAGGSDLSTGNLKLGDGTKTTPSLAFNSDSTLGIFKPDLKSIGFASGEKRIIDLRETAVVSFKDINVQNKVLTSAGISVTAVGSNYDTGSYVGVPVIGGTGLGGTVNIDVTEFLGTFTIVGTGYNEGSFFTPVETTGSGTGAEIAFVVQGIEGNIANAGSAYKPGSYTGVALTGGNGNSATADIDVLGTQTVTGSLTNGGSGYPGADGVIAGVTLTGGTGVVTPITADITLASGVVTDVAITDNGEGYVAGDVLSADAQDLSGDNAAAGSGFSYTISSIAYDGVVDLVTITSSGQGYQQLDVLSASDASLGGGGGSGFEFSISSQPGVPQNLEFASKGSGYAVDDLITLPGPTNGVSTDLLSSVGTTGDITTGSADITNVASTAGVLAGMTVVDEQGFFPEGTTVSSVSGSTVTVSATSTGTGTGENVTFESPGGNFLAVQVTASEAASIGQGAVVTKVSGTGDLATGVTTTVTAVDTSTNIVTISDQPDAAGPVVLNFTPAYGTPTTEVTFKVETLGSIDAVTVLDGGSGYDVADVLTISPTDLTQPITKVVTTVNVEVLTFSVAVPANAFSVGDTVDVGGGDAGTLPAEVLFVGVTGSQITELIIESIGAGGGQTVQLGAGTAYTINGATNVNRFALDGVIGDSFTIFLDNKYKFDVSDPSNAGHIFALSDIPGGDSGRGLLTGITANVSLSAVVGVTDTTGILPGMLVTVQSGNAVIPVDTKVLSVDSATQITMSAAATGSGSAVLDFQGTEFTDNVVRTATDLTLKVTSTTPNLYYYCTVHPNMGGSDNYEGVLTYNANNPKVFGTGGTLQVNAIGSADVITLDVETGQLTTLTAQGNDLNFGAGTITTLTSTNSKTTDTHVVGMIQSDADGDDIIEMNAGVSTNFSYGDVNIGSTIQIENTTGNLTSSGTIKTTLSFNSNDKLEITDNVISTVPGTDLVFEPASANQTKINGTTALVIPAGDISQRPLPSASYNGSIRYNTETNQYEGYNASTTSWSSLGGIRDLDGNTTILAEETIGANDNTLWFINDNVNTVRFTPEYQEYVNVKKVRSPNVAAPDYAEWKANTPHVVGDYLKYRNNIYEVTAVTTPGGLNYTAATGSEPVHTTGSETNGDLTLTWYISAVSSLTFEEIDEFRIDPLGFTDLVVNNETRISGNTLSTTSQDFNIQPNSGQKVKVVGTTSLVLPVGNNNEKGNPEQGSVRYNTDDNQFEGYNGNQWGGLGGVKDIDQDTLIKAETAPGADEDTLFFVNANNESLRLTTNELEFDNVDTLKSTNSNFLNLNASTITFSDLETVLDNTDANTAFLYSGKQNFDLGLSVGLTVDPLLRLDDQGDIFYNLGFGTGTFTGVKLFDNTLENFELKNYKVNTARSLLQRGSVNQSETPIFNPATEECAEVQLIAHNTVTGDKEFIKYSVVTKGTDIYNTEIANIRTGVQLVTTSFDFNAFNEVRITYVLNSALSTGDNVNVTIINHITKA